VTAESRVRPAVRRFAIVAFAILLPVAAHILWDYIEVRRLVDEIEAIRAKGEPVNEHEASGGQQPLVTQEHSAASYYLAGATLALGSQPYKEIVSVREWLARANPDRQSLEQLAAPLRRKVEASSDALALADKAAALPYAGFPAGTEFSFRTAGVGSLSELITARTLSLSQSGHGDEAVASALSGLQIRRALRDARWFSLSGQQVAAVLSLSRPSPETLISLQKALEAEDKPEQPLDGFLRERARYIELIWRRYYGVDPAAPRQYTFPMRSISETIGRPWFTHQAVAVLRRWAELVTVARVPWPDKAARSRAILDSVRTEQEMLGQPSAGNPLLNQSWVIGAFAQAVDATPFIVDRSSRIAIAVERFRRARGTLPSALEVLVPEYMSAIPADPFSGRPLLYRVSPQAYTVYSVGPNLKDDGGDLSPETQRPGERAVSRNIRSADVGIRVLTQP
jgi:hypothetical protein